MNKYLCRPSDVGLWACVTLFMRAKSLTRDLTYILDLLLFDIESSSCICKTQHKWHCTRHACLCEFDLCAATSILRWMTIKLTHVYENLIYMQPRLQYAERLCIIIHVYKKLMYVQPRLQYAEWLYIFMHAYINLLYMQSRLYFAEWVHKRMHA